MRTVFNLLLVLLGLAAAIVWLPDHDIERQLAVVTAIPTQSTAHQPGAVDRPGRTFSPSTPLIASVEHPGSSQTLHVAGVARIDRTAPGGVAAAQTVVTRVQSATAAVVTQSTSGATVMAHQAFDATAATRSLPLSEASRYDLVRNLQRELKRVSCYAGEIDGNWGAGSRRAMAAFTDRVNAPLPIEQPDFILLTLVQGHQGAICSRGCAAGQMLAENGRCVASPAVAQVRGSPTISNDVVRYTITQTATAPATTGSGWTTQVSRDPAATAPAPSYLTPTAVAAVVAPLAGRMAVGGPPVIAPAAAAPAFDRSPARTAVLATPAQVDDAPRAMQAAEKRERPRRTAGVGGNSRSARYAPQTYYASAPRRGRGWTGSFFGFP